MTNQQIDAIIAIVEKDAEIAGDYCNSLGQTCVLGGLLVAMGIEKDAIRKLSGTISGLPGTVEVLSKQYGLSVLEQFLLQQLNDRFIDINLRRHALIGRLNSWKHNEKYDFPVPISVSSSPTSL